MSSRVTRVALVDDDPRVLTAMSELISASGGFWVTGQLSSREDALKRGATEDADVVVVDMLLPALAEGVALTHRLSELGRVVVAISVSGAARDTALAAGASAFVEKGNEPQALLAALVAARKSRPPGADLRQS